MPWILYLIAPCHINSVLPVKIQIIFVYLILPKGLKRLVLQHLQCLAVKSIHVLDGEYLKSEYAIPA